MCFERFSKQKLHSFPLASQMIQTIHRKTVSKNRIGYYLKNQHRFHFCFISIEEWCLLTDIFVAFAGIIRNIITIIETHSIHQSKKKCVPFIQNSSATLTMGVDNKNSNNRIDVKCPLIPFLRFFCFFKRRKRIKKKLNGSVTLLFILLVLMLIAGL